MGRSALRLLVKPGAGLAAAAKPQHGASTMTDTYIPIVGTAKQMQALDQGNGVVVPLHAPAGANVTTADTMANIAIQFQLLR